MENNQSKKFIGIGIIALVLATGGYQYYKYKNPEQIKALTEQATVTPSTTTVDGSTTTITASPASSLQLKKPDPAINGSVYGVVEVGATGFNAFAVNIDQNDNWEVVKKSFGKSLANEGMASLDDIRTGLKDRIGDVAEAGAAGRNIHFIVSSGALHDAKIQTIMQELKKNYTVQPVSAEDEAKFAARAAIPKAYKGSAYVVDIGSGNTKISWYEGDRIRTVQELPGAKYYQKAQTDGEVYAIVKQAAQQVPQDKRQLCFIIGGLPYELSKEGVETNLSPRFTQLKSPDSYSAGDNAKKKAGLNIYRAIADGAGTANFVFDADANFTIGYLLARN